MFDISMEFMKDLANCLPAFIGLYFAFDFLGSLLFGKR